ncbi:MAG: YkgJ family cysteine cluster protein [Spirochaetia bacterium]|jgi:Fe-S-cluster containining protein|nr:YkgJ family cysteine cluster protein [Spirochaetia bacterium]
MSKLINCRPGCGACCVFISITSYIPGMPDGKPAGVRCVNLDENNLCTLFGQESRPAVCVSLRPEKQMCGNSSADAEKYLKMLENETTPTADKVKQ